MKQRQYNQHDIVKMHLKKNVGVKAVEKCLAVTEHCTFWSSGGTGGIHDDLGFFRVSRAQRSCEKRFAAVEGSGFADII